MSRRLSGTQLVTPIGLGLMIALTLGSYVGCKKDEPPPPLPAAPASTTPTATAPVELVPEVPLPVDAGEDADAAKKGGGSGKSLAKCCAALAQNAKSAPPPNNQYMEAAAAACNAGAAVPVLQGLLRGAGLPVACQ